MGVDVPLWAEAPKPPDAGARDEGGGFGLFTRGANLRDADHSPVALEMGLAALAPGTEVDDAAAGEMFLAETHRTEAWTALER